MEREKVIKRLAGELADIELPHPVRVGIDGVTASGKTGLADELVQPLRALGRHVIRASVDGFHNPAAFRHRRGRDSVRGYYEDSFNHDSIIASVLRPLGPDGDLRYRPARFDFRTDSEVDAPWEEAKRDSILLFDGVFLQRPELCPFWDFRIFVDADFEVAVERACVRDRSRFRSADKVREVLRRRYVPGQTLYLETVRPLEKADVVVDNNDFQKPSLNRYRSRM